MKTVENPLAAPTGAVIQPVSRDHDPAASVSPFGESPSGQPTKQESVPVAETTAETGKKGGKMDNSMFNLFAEAVAEDSEAGKFAASLHDVDINTLHQDLQTLVTQMKAFRRERRTS